MGSDNLMLVAIVNNKRDLDIASTKHWYRIPLKSAPKSLEEMSYIAFYQTKAFGRQKWSINYWAEIKSLRVVKRLELFPNEEDHPRANDKYCKIEIDELKRLPNPIISKRGRRIVFIITTLEKFKSAKEINDLFHESPLEDKLWDEFRETGIEAERQYYVAEERENYYCLDFAIFCKKGKIDVECNGDAWHSQPESVGKDNERNNFLASRGWSVLRFSSKDINGNVSGCLDKVENTINNFGGISMLDGGFKVLEEEDTDEARQLKLFDDL